jgi:hypothetical protein
MEIPPGNVQGPKGPKRPKDPGFTLTEIEPDPSTTQTPTTNSRFLVQKDVFNPTTGKMESKYVKILGVNQKKGETAYSASGFESLDEFVDSIKGS